MNRFIYFLAASLLALPILLAPADAASREKQPCAPFSFEGHSYTLCEAPLSRFDIRIFWRRPDGAPYSYLSALPRTDSKGGQLAFALNGGMFHPDYRPVGLYIEEGQELVRASRASGPGNFHLKPNGVFYAREGEAGVLETGAFLKLKPKAEFATQSGPMLEIDGKLHPGSRGPARRQKCATACACAAAARILPSRRKALRSIPSSGCFATA